LHAGVFVKHFFLTHLPYTRVMLDDTDLDIYYLKEDEDRKKQPLALN